MEKRDTDLPLEDEDGYMQCYFGDADDEVARAGESNLGAPALRRSCICLQDTQSVDMGPKKRARSLEQLSTTSLAPSSAVGATSLNKSSPSDNDQGRRGPPQIPPRPNVEVLSRFLQKRAKRNALSSSPGAAASGGGQGEPARRKYVEVDVIPPEEDCARGGEGGGRNVTPQRLSPSPSRAPRPTSYVLLQIEKFSDSTSSHTQGGPQGHSKVPVRRSKSGGCDRLLQNSAHLESEAPSLRKPRNVSASGAHVCPSSPLPPRATSLDDERLLATTGQVGLTDSELETRFNAHSISDTGPQNSTELPRSHPQAVSGGGVSIQEPHTSVPPSEFRKPPPPNKKRPPARPPGPPRKSRTTNFPGLDPQTQGTSQNPQRFGEPLNPPPVSTAPPSSSGSRTSVSPSPHARGPWKEEIVTTGVQVDPDDHEYSYVDFVKDVVDHEYEYVDFVKNRHVIARPHSGKSEWCALFAASYKCKNEVGCRPCQTVETRRHCEEE